MKAIMKPQASTRALIEKAQGGDRHAFETLLRAHRRPLERTVERELGQHLKGEADAEDVLQETHLRALRSIQRFHYQGEGSFPRWLATIARHVVLELAGKQQRGRKYQLKHDVPGAGVPPSRLARRSERFDRLEEALDQLSEEHREVILLARI